MSRNLKEVSAKSYISTDEYNGNFFSYVVTTGPSPQFKKTGALTAVSGATSLNCPAGNVLRENGKKLFPDAYPGVTTYMVGVFDNLNNLSGYINPNDPVFALFNGDRPNYLKDSVNSQTKNLGAPTLTQGSVICSDVVSTGQIRSNTVTVLNIDASNNVTIDVSLGQVFTLNATRSFTLKATGLLPGAVAFLKVTGSAYTMTLGANMESPLGNGPFGTPGNFMFFCDGNKLNL
ncbi:MAG: hypothetical protein EB127_31185 [Alphaproteobacteria bacterium]|nr:hypothetical protein [Alphaproteobacteria bacterium]